MIVKKTIGIIGGMGPMATCDLMKKIIDNTDAPCDQAHLRICVDSNTNIPDRTAAILGGGADPRPEMIKSAVALQEMGADVLIVPCNTAHFFLPDVQKCVDIPILNMLQETARALYDQGVRTAAVLATDGTVRSGLYDAALKEKGITPVYPDPDEQKMIMSIIYDYVKAGKPYPHADRVRAMQTHLLEQGVQTMILGCTELPVAFAQWDTVIPTADPTRFLARAAIRYAGGTLKE